MNQKLLGVLRAIGVLVMFSVLTALIGDIAPILHQIPVIGDIITPGLSATLTAAAFAWEHSFADKMGYNLPVGAVKRQVN